MYNFVEFKNKILEIEDWLAKEFSGIRTGMASPNLLDGVRVESYGAVLPINQVANIGIENARTLRVAPWDLSQVKAIEKAITLADLGVSISTDSNGVRVFFPELTSERRGMLMKMAKERLEKARISLRGERDSVWEEIQKQEKDGELSEDEEFRLKEEMQKIVDETNRKFEEILTKKEKEISL